MIWFSNPIGWFCGSSKTWLISYSTLINLIRSQSNLIFKDPNRWLASQTSDWHTQCLQRWTLTLLSRRSLIRIWHCSRCAHTLRRADTALAALADNARENLDCQSTLTSSCHDWQGDGTLTTRIWHCSHHSSFQVWPWSQWTLIVSSSTSTPELWTKNYSMKYTNLPSTWQPSKPL